MKKFFVSCSVCFGRLGYVALVTVVFCLVSTTSVSAQNYYRYKDANGRIVLSNSITPEFALKGYQIVDSHGRLIREVPPAPTPEELAEKKRLEAEKARQEEIARKQAEEDALLMRLYSHPDDAARARDRKLSEIDVLHSQKSNSLRSLNKKILELESKAANAERSGKKVSEQILEKIAGYYEETDRLKNELQAYEANKVKITEEFETKINRLKTLMQ